MWTDITTREPGEQVACCIECARRGYEEDVPTKEQWCRRERIADRSFMGRPLDPPRRSGIHEKVAVREAGSLTLKSPDEVAEWEDVPTKVIKKRSVTPFAAVKK